MQHLSNVLQVMIQQRWLHIIILMNFTTGRKETSSEKHIKIGFLKKAEALPQLQRRAGESH